MRLPLRFLVTPQIVYASCGCGYRVAGENNAPWLFTQALESDFTKVTDLSHDAEWVRQQFNVTAEAGRGKYGKAFSLNNVAPKSPSLDASNSNGGIQLRVGGNVVDGAVPTAEIDSARMDMYWGSYRAGMKLTNVKGTCGAFFWYFNDTQEIDMEFLSREFDSDKKIFPVNLVVQSRASAKSGYDASKTGTYKTVNLGFNPMEAFHEYRFDYLRNKVYFYADSKLLAEMEGNAIPDSAGHLILQHWSNGNPKWSGGPPKEDATMTVSYVKAYFNSSHVEATTKGLGQCKDSASQLCDVKDVTARNASSGGEFLTNQDGKTSDDKDSAAMVPRVWPATLCGMLAMSLVMRVRG